jgi:hypothetical protein
MSEDVWTPQDSAAAYEAARDAGRAADYAQEFADERSHMDPESWYRPDRTDDTDAAIEDYLARGEPAMTADEWDTLVTQPAQEDAMVAGPLPEDRTNVAGSNGSFNTTDADRAVPPSIEEIRAKEAQDQDRARMCGAPEAKHWELLARRAGVAGTDPAANNNAHRDGQERQWHDQDRACWPAAADADVDCA